MKTLVLVMVLLALPASAQSLKVPTIVFLSAAGFDMSTTLVALRNPNVHETNPMYAWSQNRLGTMAVTMALGESGEAWLLNRLGRHHKKVASAILYGLAGVRIYNTVHNLSYH